MIQSPKLFLSKIKLKKPPKKTETIDLEVSEQIVGAPLHPPLPTPPPKKRKKSSAHFWTHLPMCPGEP